MAIDKAMREEAENDEAAANGEGGYGDGINGYVEEGDPLTEEDTRGQQAAQQVARRGLLGPRVASVLNLVSAPRVPTRELRRAALPGGIGQHR